MLHQQLTSLDQVPLDRGWRWLVPALVAAVAASGALLFFIAGDSLLGGLFAAALAATVLVFAQGYLGGRMTYQQAVGIHDGGQLAQSAAGASRLHVALAKGTPEVQAGKQAFSEMGLGCAACHVPSLTTGRSEVAALDQVTFYPFTDLLLHDMGPDLDDGYTEGNATSSEWRTAPLWGIGLAERAQGGSAFYLHDGRARTLRSAIGYHGGEGATSRAATRGQRPLRRDLIRRRLPP